MIPGADEDANATAIRRAGRSGIIGAGADATGLVQTAADRVLQTVMPSQKRLVLRGLTIPWGGRNVDGGGLNATALVLIEDAAFVGKRVVNRRRRDPLYAHDDGR